VHLDRQTVPALWRVVYRQDGGILWDVVNGEIKLPSFPSRQWDKKGRSMRAECLQAKKRCAESHGIPRGFPNVYGLMAALALNAPLAEILI